MPTMRRLILLGTLAWLAMVAVDFLLHGGLLAGLYATEDDPFLLPPERAFALIPLGYACFAMLAGLLTWLMSRMSITGWRRGAVFGLALGALMWGALVLGLLSISTMPPAMALAWFLGQSIELAIGGALLGAGLAGRSAWKLAGLVLALFIICIAATIVLQNTGLAPALKH